MKAALGKKFFFAFLLLSVPLFNLFPDDWVLAAESFALRNQGQKTESELNAASVLPSLLLEQISSGTVRELPKTEILDRKLDVLLTERLSLFLQLSKEFQERDSLVIKKTKPQELKKALEAADKKISEIQKKIESNLNEEKKAVEESGTTIQEENDAHGFAKLKNFILSLPFFRKTEDNKIVTEKVSVYKNETTALFTPSEFALSQGFDSRAFAKEVQAEKINGLMTGSVSSYGNYLAVTVEIFSYPGAKSIGSVTDVGSLSDIMSLSRRLVQRLAPKIANSLPILLEFAVSPKEAEENCTITIDGVIYSDFREKIVLDAGIHAITIEAENYNTANLTYQFSGAEKFFIQAKLLKKMNGIAEIVRKDLRGFEDGIFYAYGIEDAKVSGDEQKAELSVNGRSVLGVFSVSTNVEGEDEESHAFFVIDEDDLLKAGNKGNLNFAVDVNPFDRQKNIDKRRRWMYVAYSALVCSLPYTFYNLGNFTTKNQAYAQRGELESGISKSEVVDWRNRLYVSLGITGALGAWTVFELVRYLHAADQVLPSSAKEYNGELKIKNSKKKQSMSKKIETDDSESTSE